MIAPPVSSSMTMSSIRGRLRVRFIVASFYRRVVAGFMDVMDAMDDQLHAWSTMDVMFAMDEHDAS